MEFVLQVQSRARSADILQFTDDGNTNAFSSDESDSFTKLSSCVIEDECVAFGAVRVQRDSSSGLMLMQGLHQNDKLTFPPSSITTLAEKNVLKIQKIDHISRPDYFSVRIFLLPEDVHKGSSSTFLHDRRRSLKRLLSFIDVSPRVWTGDFDPSAPLQTYVDPPAESESLFHIFNTLNSPAILNDIRLSEDAALRVFEDSMDRLKTNLYPYQKRSVVEMLRKEISPAKTADPRKPLHYDAKGKKFYMDIQEGIILREQILYEESRGGVLAETMGYGKTLITLALICATRGHFPSVPEGRLDVPPSPRGRTGSLLQMAAAAAGRFGIPWKAEFHALEKAGYSHERCVTELKKNHRKYVEPIFHPQNPDRKGKRVSEKVVRVCYTTLVVVPQNLMVQWQHEIKTHVHEDVLDVLVIDGLKKPIPPSFELARYDLVLITKTRLEAEYRDDDLHNGKSRRGEAIYQSPLTEMRWLRVICDEGHAFAGSATRTNALAMLDKMYIERRWVVSGTPSNSLVGVEVGIAADTSDAPRTAKIDQSLHVRRNPHAAQEESKDIEKLRQLVSGFLKMPPWANKRGADHTNWKKYLSPFDKNGQRRRTACLRTLLQSMVVRHRIQDIDADLDLPPLFNKTVYLEPSYYDKLSLNLFVMVLTANAVTSERTDEDYLFHTRNRKDLEMLIRNLRQSSFHWVGFQREHVVEALKTCNKYFDGHIDNISDSDGALLTEAILTGERALNDDGWVAFSGFHEIGVYVDNFPETGAIAWALHGKASRPLLLGAGQARSVQQWVEEHTAEPLAGLTGAGLREMQAVTTRIAEQNQKSKKASNSAKISEEPTLKGQSSSETAESPRKRRRTSSSISLSSESPLAKTEIVGFSSAKLSYLIDQVLKHQKKEKIIIFYDVGNIAYWIAEALELLSVKYLIYASTLTVARRASYLATFNKSEEFRVLLMDLGQAALGLHLACASRVYMVSPIWQPNIESQAIKRAHRIGQTNPVYVETLVLRGTLEDMMLTRRRQMSDGELKKASKNLLDDDTMNQMIQKQKFLKFKPDEYDSSNQFARLAQPQQLFGRLGRAVDKPGEGLVLVDGDTVAPRKKQQKKMVRIATPS